MILITACSDEKERARRMIVDNTSYLNDLQQELLNENERILTVLKFDKKDSIVKIRERILAELDSKSIEVLELSGGKNDMLFIINPYDTKIVEKYFFQQGKAEELKQNINREVEHAVGLSLNIWTTIKDASDIKIFANDPYQSSITFGKHYFGEKNIYETMHSFEQLKLKFIEEEHKYLLDKLLEIQSM